MPIGNGDLGLNVWTEQNGDLVFLIGKTDAYTENGQLVKLGRVRVHLTPNPFASASGFQQELKLRDGRDRRSAAARAARRCASGWTPTGPWRTSRCNGAASQSKCARAVELWRLQPRETRQDGAELFGRGVFRELNGIPGGQEDRHRTRYRPARAGETASRGATATSAASIPVVFENQHLESAAAEISRPAVAPHVWRDA